MISVDELKLDVNNDSDRETSCLGVRFNIGDKKRWREAREKVGEHSDQIRFDQGLTSTWKGKWATSMTEGKEESKAHTNTP